MNEAFVIGQLQQALLLVAQLAGPVLLVMLVVGLLIAVIQSATGVNESTLPFVPKLAIVGIALFVGGSAGFTTMVAFTRQMFEIIPLAGH